MNTNNPKPVGKSAGGAADQSRAMDLSSLFNVAAQALTANQASLNQADTQNQNHGDNMVQIFNAISQVMANQQGATPSQQLNSASQYLAQNGTSGSAHVYSQGLAQAAQQLQGQSAVTPDNAMTLIQSLLGGGQSAQGSAQSAAPAMDLLGSLLGGQSAPQSGSQQNDGIDLGDILNAGMNFMNAKQQGQDNLQAALTALMSSGPMANPHRQQSGQVVANALLQVVQNMAKQR
jgi:hypothetical protein